MPFIDQRVVGYKSRDTALVH